MKPDHEQSDLGDFAWGCLAMLAVAAMTLLAVVLYTVLTHSR